MSRHAITKSVRAKIRKLYLAGGLTQKTLAIRFGISAGAVRMIVNEKS